MSESYSYSSTGGIGVLGLLGVVFVTLKLIGYITWSWWWVTAPFWGGFALAIAIIVLIFIAWLAKHAIKKAFTGKLSWGK